MTIHYCDICAKPAKQPNPYDGCGDPLEPISIAIEASQYKTHEHWEHLKQMSDTTGYTRQTGFAHSEVCGACRDAFLSAISNTYEALLPKEDEP